MSCKLKQSTTTTRRIGPFVDMTDGVTPETGLAGSMVVYLSKNGAAFAARNSATAITHDRDGFYAVEFNATDTGTLGELKYEITVAATHLPVFGSYEIVPANVYDSLVGNTDKLQVDEVELGGNTSIDGQPLINAARLELAVAVGRVSGAATNSPIFRDAANTKNRVTTTGDASGNRTNVVLDGA